MKLEIAMLQEISSDSTTMSELLDSSIIINGDSYGILKGYLKFGFWYDETTKKFSIANVETKETTEPFCDEIIFSELPLETWTADYVVVRIGEFYYLADCQGNCYHESKQAYEICRNVFLAADKTYLINKSLKVICPEEDAPFSIFITEAGYKIAYILRNVQERDAMDLINSDGKTNTEIPYWKNRWYGNEIVIISFAKIDKWYVSYEKMYTVYFIDKEFKYVWYSTNTESCEIIGKLSQTYSNGFSGYFKDEVFFRKYGNLEFVVYKGKTYFFKPKGEIENFDFIVQTPKYLNNFIVYRIDDVIYYRDFEGEIIAREKLSPKELYQIILNEELLAK